MSVGERKSRISRWNIREKKYGHGKSITTEVKKRKWLWKSAGSPTNQENQLVAQPEETDNPNESRKSAGSPTNQENQLVAQPIKKISW
jgi:hypothetical protein